MKVEPRRARPRVFALLCGSAAVYGTFSLPDTDAGLSAAPVLAFAAGAAAGSVLDAGLARLLDG